MADQMTAEQLIREIREIEVYARNSGSTAPRRTGADFALTTVANTLSQLAARISGMAAVPDPAQAADGYYIACFRHRRDEAHEMVLWWRAGNDGYTTDLAQAGIYHDKHENGVDDVAVPVAFARKRRRFEVIDPWADGNVMFQAGALLLAALAKESAAPEPPHV